jgi:hypothetical protein
LLENEKSDFGYNSNEEFHDLEGKVKPLKSVDKVCKTRLRKFNGIF